MEEQILQKIEEQNQKIYELSASINKIKKYFMIIVWVTIALFVLPLIAAIFIIPSFIDSYTANFDLDGLI